MGVKLGLSHFTQLGSVREERAEEVVWA